MEKFFAVRYVREKKGKTFSLSSRYAVSFALDFLGCSVCNSKRRCE